MTFDQRCTLQACVALLQECRRQVRLTATGDATVQGIAYAEASLAAIKAETQIQRLLSEEEEEAA